jgi:hypothetical protein
MANIERRPNGVWRARYYNHAVKQHVKHFPRKIDAKAWIDEVTASVLSEAGTAVCTSGRVLHSNQRCPLWRPDRVPPCPEGVAPTPVGSVTSLRCWLLCGQEREG